MKNCDPMQILSDRLDGVIPKRPAISQAALARELGIKPAYLADIFAGRRNPGPKVLKALGLVKRITYHKANGAK